MCSERDSPLEPFVLLAPGQPELVRLICGAHLSPPVLTRKQKRPRVNSLVCDRAAALYAAGPPEALSRMSRLVTQAAERERELARARSQRLKKAARKLVPSPMPPLTPLHIGAGTGRHYKVAAGHHSARWWASWREATMRDPAAEFGRGTSARCLAT